MTDGTVFRSVHSSALVRWRLPCQHQIALLPDFSGCVCSIHHCAKNRSRCVVCAACLYRWCSIVPDHLAVCAGDPSESSQWSETPGPVPKDQHQDLCGRSICYHRRADPMVRKCIVFRCFAGSVGRNAVHLGSEVSIC